jgi:hypothetical protein
VIGAPFCLSFRAQLRQHSLFKQRQQPDRKYRFADTKKNPLSNTLGKPINIHGSVISSSTVTPIMR